MPWSEVTVMSQRTEFMSLAKQESTNFSALCRRFGISRKTGYKFLHRYDQEGEQGLRDRSRRPRNSPNATDHRTEKQILELRDRHPAWGARKLKRRLEDLGYRNLPAPSTITEILKRNGRIAAEESKKRKAWQRFEAERPNDLWQMDFKGYFTAREGRCYPLTIVDDHSRYSLCLAACTNERKETVQRQLRSVFLRYGLPAAILVDNGPPWGSDSSHQDTRLTVWLLRLGVRVIHSRPYHPQTLGKDERFHRTLRAEVIAACVGRSLTNCQRLFDRWRVIYNTERPHEALAMNVPATYYQLSKRSFPEKLPELRYAPGDQLRKVNDGGCISFINRQFKVGKAFIGQQVALRPTTYNNKFDVYFSDKKIKQILLA